MNSLKVIVLRSKLLEGIGFVERSVGGAGASLPILSHVLLKAEGGALVLTTTNLETVMEYSLGCKVLSSGSFAVPFSVFRDIVRNLNSERISLTQGDAALEVVTDNYEASLKGQSADDFPLVPSIQNTTASITFRAAIFRDILSSVAGATQYSDIRPEISGVYVALKDGRLHFAATDSFRLAERVAGRDSFDTSLEDVSFIIPIKTVGDLLRVVPDDEKASFEILYDTNQVVFVTDACRIISRLVEGTFPDYAQIMPTKFSHEIVLGRHDFLRAVQLVSSLSGKGSDVTIRAQGGEKVIEIYSGEGALGENVYRVPAKIQGGAFSIALNWRYVIDGLKIYKSDEITLGVNAPDQPVGITSTTMPDLKYIVMPIKS